MKVSNNIENMIYQKFITYAIRKSDIFMLVVKYCDAAIFNVEEHIKMAVEEMPNFDPDEETILRLKTMEQESRENVTIRKRR